MSKTIYFIRHGESVANAGGRWEGKYQDIPLTERGKSQAQRSSEYFTISPDLITYTAYYRTFETAKPLLEKFPTVPTEILPVQEFTYLNTEIYAKTTVQERRERATQYWKNNDPSHNDGGWAESFLDCMTRTKKTLNFLAEKKEKTIVVYTHGQVLQIIKALLHPKIKQESPEYIMRFFREWELANPVKNAEILRATIDDNWTWSQIESVFVPKV